MPEQKMTYQERLQMAAQKHADKWNNLVVDSDAGWTDADCLGDAAVTIAAQAEAIREYFDSMIFPTLNSFPNQVGWAAIQLDAYLLEHGYIEPKTGEQQTYDSIREIVKTQEAYSCKHEDYITDQEGRRYCTDCQDYTDNLPIQ